MDKRKRYLILAIALAVVFVGGACLCSNCSLPFGLGTTPAEERIQENAPIVSGADLGTSEDVIYCVVPANRIDSGTTFYARWIYENEPFEDTPTITADRDYTDTYIEFHIEPKDFGVLEKGDYACKIYVNGNPVQTVDFQVK
jgi:hypothetical protein